MTSLSSPGGREYGSQPVRPITVRAYGEPYVSADDVLLIAKRTHLAVSTVVRVLAAQAGIR